MSRSIDLTVPMPRKLARLRFPKALSDRLRHLMMQKKPTPAERKEARALEQLADTLVSLKRGARITAG